MEKLELIEYFKSIQSLEVALYTHKKLQPLYFDKLQSFYPKKPNLIQSNTATKPTPPKKPESKFIQSIALLCTSLLCFGLAFAGDFLFAIGTIAGVLCFMGGLMGMFLTISETIGYKKQLQEYQSKHLLYKQDLKKDRALNAENLEKYQRDLETFNENVTKFNSKKLKIQQEFNDISMILENELSRLYNADIIFPKYRNLVAISTILEYLASGRCLELEGPNGAYNLYEMELRQNIIISQLSSITRNLEQIKNNQYILYQELNNSNRIIREMLNNIGNELSISNYHAQINTIALTTPQVSYGVII